MVGPTSPLHATTYHKEYYVYARWGPWQKRCVANEVAVWRSIGEDSHDRDPLSVASAIWPISHHSFIHSFTSIHQTRLRCVALRCVALHLQRAQDGGPADDHLESTGCFPASRYYYYFFFSFGVVVCDRAFEVMPLQIASATCSSVHCKLTEVRTTILRSL